VSCSSTPQRARAGFLITADDPCHAPDRGKSSFGKWGMMPNRAEKERRPTKRFPHYLTTNVVGIDLNPNLVKAREDEHGYEITTGSGGLYQGNSLEAPATLGTNELREKAPIGGPRWTYW